MATQKLQSARGLIRHGAWSALALGIVLISAHLGRAQQDPPGSPVQTRETLRQAIDLYKGQDYEKAAQYFSYVQSMQQTLSTEDRKDLANFSNSNATALRGRQDGAAQIRLADAALKENRPQEAANLLKSLNANPYLGQAERQQVSELNKKQQAASPNGAAAPGKSDVKSLLAAGRAALQQGDLATAKALAEKADKASSVMPSWVQWWNDSPAKLRRDIQTAEAKLPPANPPEAGRQPGPEPVSATSKLMSFLPFGGGSTPAKKDPASSRADEMIVRQIIKDGFFFLEQANEPEKAQFIALKAKEKVKELNITFSPGERTPDDLLEAIQRRTGAAAAVNPAPKIEPKSEPLPQSNDPRVLLKHGRTMLEKKKFDDAEKACSKAQASKASWGLFEDNPDKLRRDIQKLRQSHDRDESVRLLVEARKLLAAGSFDEAEKKAYKAQQLHGPYGVFDFGDRPTKLIEEINRAKLAKGPSNPNDKQITRKDDPNAKKVGIPFDPPAADSSANKNRAVVMVREARELERQGQLYEARLKASEARVLKATFLPDEDSPDAVLWSLSAKCDRQIVTHLQTALQHASNADDAQRFQKAQEHILAARKLAHAFELDPGRIDQTAHQLQQAANTGRPIAQAGGIGIGAAPIPVDVSTGDPQKDAVRQEARKRLQHAQMELAAGKYAQARVMAEALYKEEFGIQKDVLALIRSISAEEYNQHVLEARRNFDAGLDAFRNQEHRKALFLFQAIDTTMLPEHCQARLRDIMATRDMNIVAQAQTKEMIKGGTIIEQKTQIDPPGAGAKRDALDEYKAIEAVKVQEMRTRGQEALRTAHAMFNAKPAQKEEAVKVLKQYVEQVNLYQFDPAKAAELRRFPEARIQQYQTDIADDKLVGAQKNSRFVVYHDENGRQREIHDKQVDMAEKMKVVHEMLKQNKLKEAEAELRKLREIDPENTAILAALHIAVNKRNQEDYDRTTHKNEKAFLDLLNHGLGDMASMEKPVTFGPGTKSARPKGEGQGIAHPLSDPREQQIEYRLRQPISLNFRNVPLEQAIKDLGAASGLPVVLDYRALQEDNVRLDAPLNIDVPNISMKSALNIMLDQVKLTYAIKNQVLMITTHKETSGRLVRVTYPVADLIVIVPDHPLPDVYNIQKCLERSMQPSPYFNNFASTPAFPMSPGETVSSHSEGLGGAFGGRYPPGMHGQNGQQSPAQKDRSKDAMAEILKELLQNTVQKNTWESMGGNGSIQYFPFGMAMVINQTQEVQEEVALLLATLRRLQDLQVSVELRAVLVSETFFERIGVDFDMNIRTPTNRREPDLVTGSFVPAPFINRTGAGFSRLISGMTNAGTLTPDLSIPIRNSSFNYTTPLFGGYTPEAGLSLGLAFLSDIQVFMFLEAVQGDRRAHIMQAPKLTVFNGQTAFIGGFSLRPTVTSLAPTLLGNNQTVLLPVPNQMSFGLGFQVQPVVSPDRRFIRLNVTPQAGAGTQDPAGAMVLAFPGSNPGQFSPPAAGAQPFFANNPMSVNIIPLTTTVQVANTTVNVPDGGTVLLGGFKFLAEERTEYGPPVLSKIPYLSRLFRNVGWSRDGSTLIYLVTARVIMVQEEERLFLGEIEPIPGR
ncbi:MAG: hypothetical protein HY289_05520 [Planctomycetes bacterium]|nr:hypothetical protein [Planctomycetota bacterium]